MFSLGWRRCGQYTLYILLNFVALLLEVPVIRLFERAICFRHFQGNGLTNGNLNGIEESECKIPEIQNPLTSTIGVKMFCDAIPGLLTAIYYGKLADRAGRRVVLGLAVLGYALMLAWLVIVGNYPAIFPYRAMWLSSTFLFIGGGQRIFNSMIFTLVSDALEDDDRSRYLFLLAVGPHVCRLIAPRIAAVLMGNDVLLPFFLAFSCIGLIGMIIPFVEIKKAAPKDFGVYQAVPNTDTAESDQNHLYDSDLEAGSVREANLSTSPDVEHRHRNRNRQNSWSPLIQSNDRVQNYIFKLLDWCKAQGNSSLGVLNNPGGRFCLAAFFIKRLAFASEGFVFQYASEKFGWELRDTTWLRTTTAVGAIIATLVLGPITHHCAERWSLSPFTVDLNTIRGSLVTLSVSFFGAWIADSGFSLTIAMLGCGLGEAFEPALQAFVLFFTESSQNARVFTTIAQCDTIAELVAGPLNSWLLSIGRGPGHPSDGICFLTSACMFTVLLMYSASNLVRK